MFLSHVFRITVVKMYRFGKEGVWGILGGGGVFLEGKGTILISRYVRTGALYIYKNENGIRGGYLFVCLFGGRV